MKYLVTPSPFHRLYVCFLFLPFLNTLAGAVKSYFKLGQTINLGLTFRQK